MLTRSPARRARRPAQRRQVHAVQPDHRRRGAPSSPPVPGTTRDVITQPVVWRGVDFDADRHRRHVRRERGSAARARARAGPPRDAARRPARASSSTAARAARRATTRSPRRCATTGKPVILAVNKTDDRRARDGAMEFYQLGFEPVVEIAAEHGAGRRRPARRDRGAAPARRLRLTGARVRSPAADAESRDGAGGLPARKARSASRSSGGRTSASRRSSTGCCARSASLVSDMPGTTRDAVDTVLRWHRRAVPDRRHGGHPAARARWRGPGRSNRSA